MNSLLERFKENITQQSVIKKTDRLLLAVSGGVDSMVLLDMVFQLNYYFEIAHCNFNLRGAESDGDEQLVVSEAKKNGVKIHIKSFDTKLYANENKLSIEMAARELRYSWFDDLCVSRDLKYIAVAHNKNDVAETMLINLTRGSGLKGLTGIKYQNSNIIRPLLFADRVDIENYAMKNNVKYRTDSSNKTNDFTRNKFRNIILPELKKINPSIINTLAVTALRLDDAYSLYAAEIEEEISDITQCEDDIVKVDIEKLEQTKKPRTVLFEIVSDYGFSNRQIDDILDSLKSQSGKKIFSQTHILLKNRKELLISPIKIEDVTVYEIGAYSQIVTDPFVISQQIIPYTKEISLKTSSNVALFDYNKIKYPLTIRKWKDGDSFIPLGMKGRKKLSDFFIDQKLSLIEKENVYVLLCEEKIVWVIGYRISDEFKVSKSTSQLLRIECVLTSV